MTSHAPGQNWNRHSSLSEVYQILAKIFKVQGQQSLNCAGTPCWRVHRASTPSICWRHSRIAASVVVHCMPHCHGDSVSIDHKFQLLVDRSTLMQDPPRSQRHRGHSVVRPVLSSSCLAPITCDGSFIEIALACRQLCLLTCPRALFSPKFPAKPACAN